MLIMIQPDFCNKNCIEFIIINSIIMYIGINIEVKNEGVEK